MVGILGRNGLTGGNLVGLWLVGVAPRPVGSRVVSGREKGAGDTLVAPSPGGKLVVDPEEKGAGEAVLAPSPRSSQVVTSVKKDAGEWFGVVLRPASSLDVDSPEKGTVGDLGRRCCAGWMGLPAMDVGLRED